MLRSAKEKSFFGQRNLFQVAGCSSPNSQVDITRQEKEALVNVVDPEHILW